MQEIILRVFVILLIMLNSKSSLIFVYNADSTFFAVVSDVIKKYTKPSEYECSLCMVTYGVATMKSEWKEYLQTIPNNKRFFHRDEFLKEFPNHSEIKLPAIFSLIENKLEILVSADEIDEAKDVSSMITLMKSKIG